MKNKYKILSVIIGIILIGSILLGTSYALWIYTAVQDGSNVVNSDCFDLSFQGSNDINLESTLPLSEYRGQNLEPYTFTIKNICNHSASYEVNLETLNTSTMDVSVVRYKLNTKSSKILGQTKEVDPSNYVNSNVKQANNIAKGILKSYEEMTFNLRIRIDGSSTVEQSANKTYESKIVVIASLSKEVEFNGAKLVSGPLFNKTIKELAGDTVDEFEKEQYDSVVNMLKSGMDLSEQGMDNHSGELVLNIYNELNDYGALATDFHIKSIVKTTQLPNETFITKIVSAPDSTYEIVAWYDNSTIYLYSESEKLYMNENSSIMFGIIANLSSIDFNCFDTSLVNDYSGMFVSTGFDSLNLSSFNTENATDMTFMFSEMDDITSINIENFNTSQVEKMYGMFGKSNRLTTIEVKDFDVSNVIESDKMFENCEALVGGAGTTYDASHVDKEYARIDEPTNSKPGYFTLKTN